MQFGRQDDQFPEVNKRIRRTDEELHAKCMTSASDNFYKARERFQRNGDRCKMFCRTVSCKAKCDADMKNNLVIATNMYADESHMCNVKYSLY